MKYEELKRIILDVKLGERKTIYQLNSDTDLFIVKPTSVPTKLKNSSKYDPLKNFQIGLSKKGKKEFLPNHLRIMIDLEFKKQEDKEKAEFLFDVIESVYDGADPLDYIIKINSLSLNERFENSLTIICLAQLFFLEQDINYDFGKVQPPRSYLMGYIRMIRLNIDEIDKLLWNSTRHPPRIEFRSKKCLEKINNS